jgi:hypothetical protein
MALYGQNYIIGTKFINFLKNDGCSRNHVAVSNTNEMHDHHHQIEARGISWVNSAEDSKLFLYEPSDGWRNPSECVDMDCDGPKKAMLVDLDGSFSTSGERTTYMGISEKDYGDETGSGLGNSRIPGRFNIFVGQIFK